MTDLQDRPSALNPPAAAGSPAGAPPRARHGAALAWAVVAGEVVHVSRFAALTPRRRPEARCPECDSLVVLKLGRVRSHHVAHAPDAVCAATQPETALHINAKHHVAKQLRRLGDRGEALRLARACLSGRVRSRWSSERPSDLTWEEWDDPPCPALDVSAWGLAWDAVHVEARLTALESRRVPDLLLLRQGRPVAAVEIFVTHRVDEEKARVLADLGLPWLEVRAEDVLPPDGDGRLPWDAGDPLPIFREGPACRWRCPTHQQRSDEWQDERRRQAEEEHERRRHTTEVKALRVVDVMHPSLNHYRRVYRVEERRTDGVTHTVALALDADTLLALPFRSEAKAHLWRQLRERCERDLSTLAARPGTILDCPMPAGREWIVGSLATTAWERAVREIWTRHPLEPYYPWRYRPNRAEGRWFIPQDLRDVSWMRPADEPLRPHPAADRPLPARASVRTPAPGGQERRRPAPTAAPAVGAGLGAAGKPERRPPHPGSAGTSVRGSRLRDSDLPGPVSEVISHPGYRLFVLAADGAYRETVVGVPSGKVRASTVRVADQTLAGAGVPRVWLSPPGDWSAALRGVPWAPLMLDGAGTLGLPRRRWPLSLAEFFEALRTGALAPETVIGWDERARLAF